MSSLGFIILRFFSIHFTTECEEYHSTYQGLHYFRGSLNLIMNQNCLKLRMAILFLIFFIIYLMENISMPPYWNNPVVVFCALIWPIGSSSYEKSSDILKNKRRSIIWLFFSDQINCNFFLYKMYNLLTWKNYIY